MAEDTEWNGAAEAEAYVKSGYIRKTFGVKTADWRGTYKNIYITEINLVGPRQTGGEAVRVRQIWEGHFHPSGG